MDPAPEQPAGGAVVDEVEVDTDASRIQIDRIHGWLKESYWLTRVRRDVVERAARNSVVVGAYLREDGRQVGYARAVTDRATFAYVADVFVVRELRGRGVATRMVRALHEHPELQTLKHWVLVTADAQPLYRSLGYDPVDPQRWLGRGMPRSAWQEPEVERPVTNHPANGDGAQDGDGDASQRKRQP
jgi:GNAT superfamily N-acetyltransferase